MECVVAAMSYNLLFYSGLLELEASLPDFVTQPRIRAPQKPPMGAFGYVKKKYRLTKELEDMSKVSLLFYVLYFFVTRRWRY